MEWHVNDLSLAGQFSSPLAFRTALEPILRIRLADNSGAKLFCSRLLVTRDVTSTLNLQQAVFAIADRNFTQQVLTWLSKTGPFCDEGRPPDTNEYLEFEGNDVTQLGLGEAARRCLDGNSAGTFSFLEANFERTPLRVQHLQQSSSVGSVAVPNIWDITLLRQQSEEPVRSWPQLISVVKARMNLLIFSEDINERLVAEPFDSVVAETVRLRLQVLQKLAEETLSDGSRTEAGKEVYRIHFTGDTPAFTDESDGNKRNFKSDLTFRDPSNRQQTLFCPWHGKVKRLQFRIHFEWPRPQSQQAIKVVYIGPKITKH